MIICFKIIFSKESGYKMSEKNKACVVFSISTLLLIAIVSIFLWQLKEENKIVNNIKNIKNSSSPQIIYLTRPSCSYCNLLEPIMDDLKEEYNLNYNIINIDELSNIQLQKILKVLKINNNVFGTPYLSIVKDGKVVAEHNGFADENVIFEFFQTNGIISSEKQLFLNYISIDDINNIIDNKSDLILLLGEVGNEKVNIAKKKMKEIGKKKNLNVSYFDISTLTDEEQKNLLYKLNYDGELDIPILLIIKNGSVQIIEKDTNNFENLFN